MKNAASEKYHDLVAIENAKEELPAEVIFHDDQYQTLKNTDVLAVVTEWKNSAIQTSTK